MQNKIIEILRAKNKPLDTIELTTLLKIDNLEDHEQMLKILVELENQNIIAVNSNHKFYYLNPKIYLQGVISINKKGFGFVKINNNQEEYYVHQKDLNNALDGDQVIFVLKSKSPNNDKKVEAQIVKIIQRNLEYIMGVVKKNKNNKKYLEVLNNKLQQYKAEILNLKAAVENTVVKAAIIKANSTSNTMQVKILEVIGNVNQPGVDILTILHEFNIKVKFDNETLQEANQIAPSVSLNDPLLFTTRKDLRDELLVTIDGNDSKDFDDAICVTENQDGTYRLLVAIADVAHYVTANSFLDKEAFARGCSVYLIDRVVPMLPERLSNGICSLNPHEIRLVMCCEIIIDKKGEVINSSIFEGVMESKARLTYENVNKLFKGETTTIVPEISNMLYQARRLYKILLTKKNHDGVVDFDFDEPKFITNKSGKIIDIVNCPRDEAEKLIEQFMIRANETVAETVFWMDLPFIYRVHDQPKEKKLRELYAQLSLMGLNIKGKLENIHSKDIQQVLDKLRDQKDFKVISALFLRSMEKAKYSAVNDGHFGLASKCYTHFTSPIRRYPDLIVHRLLKEYLINNKINAKVIKENREFTLLASEQSSNCEVKAMECEREVDQMKEAEYMEDKVGMTFPGIIFGVTAFGIFVQLENTIEGLVHISDLRDDFYIFDEKTLTLIGERKKQRLTLGKRVKIKVKKASKQLRQIDFTLIN